MPLIRLDKKHVIDTDSKEVKGDGLRVWIGGEPGSGKSNACMLIVAQYIEQGGQALILDVHGEYSALWSLRPGGKRRIVTYGYGDGHPVGEESVELVMNHLRDGHSVVLDLSHWALKPRVCAAFVGDLIHELYVYRQQNPKGNTLVLVEEAHIFAPQNQSVGDADNIRTFVLALTGGRKFGLHVVMASQRQSLVDINVVSQCNVRLFLRVSEQKDWRNVVRNYLPPKCSVTWYKDDKTDLNKFDSGDAILVSRWFPVERVHLNQSAIPVDVTVERAS